MLEQLGEEASLFAGDLARLSFYFLLVGRLFRFYAVAIDEREAAHIADLQWASCDVMVLALPAESRVEEHVPTWSAVIAKRHAWPQSFATR